MNRPILSELRVPLCVVIVYVGLLFNWWANAGHTPLHDTLHVYETFQIAFSQFIKTGDLPQWLPYSAYGIPTHLRDVITMPTFYIAAIPLCAVLHIHDAWLVYRILMFVDAGIYGIGIYVLGRQFAPRLPAGIVAASLLWTLVLDWNFQLTLRLVSLMPLVLVFLVRGARSGDLRGFIYAVIVALLSCWGVPHYDVPVFGYIYVLSAAALLIAYRPRFYVQLNLGTFALCTFALALGASTGYLYLTSISGLDFFTPGRNSVTLEVSRMTFLTYGAGGIKKTGEALIAVPLESTDTLFYAGATVTVFALYAVWRARSRALWAFLALFTLTLVFCWGRFSPVAWLAFYLPGMSYVRHIGLMYAIPKTFVSPIAAIGLENFLGRMDMGGDASDDNIRREVALSARLVGLLALLLGCYYYVTQRWHWKGLVPYTSDLPWPNIALIAVAVGGFAGIAVIARRASPRLIMPLLMGLVLVQSISYQAFYTYDRFNQPWELPPELRGTRTPSFVEARAGEVVGQQGAWFEALTHRGAFYPELDSFLGFDPCTPNTRVDYFAGGVAELFRREFGPSVEPTELWLLRVEHPGLAIWKVLGCGIAKAQWVSEGQAEAIPAGAPWPEDCVGRALCLENDRKGERRLVPWPGGEPPLANTLAVQGIVVSSFSFNSITFMLTAAQPGWLVYADAYHPDWHAIVNEKEVPVWRANFAFKAVKLGQGPNTIRFYFQDTLRNWLFWTFGVTGTVALFALVTLSFVGILRARPTTIG